jgi:hypothetical protein
MKTGSLSKCSGLLKPASSVLKEHKYGLMPSNTSDCLTKHGNTRFCTCLINVTVSSPLPLFTDQQFIYYHGACHSSFILNHKIQELNHRVLNLLPPVLHSHPLIFFSLLDSTLQWQFATDSDISSLPLHTTMVLFMQPKHQGCKHKLYTKAQYGIQTES